MSDGRPQRAAIPLFGVAVVASQSLVPTAGANPTPAFPAAEHSCNDRTLDWDFDSDWPSQQQAWAEEGLQYIDNARDLDGSSLVEIDPSSEAIAVKWTDLGADTYGSANCTLGAEIDINSTSTFQSHADFYRRTALHELGHLAGMEHSSDGPPGGAPTMATCKGQPGLPFAWANDDIAYQNFLFAEPYNFDATDVLANRGFEATSTDAGTAYWTGSNGSTSYKSSGGRSGLGNVAWMPGNSSGYLFQRIDLVTGDLIPPSGSTDLYVSASAQGRLIDPPNGSSYKSAISLSVYTRSVDYDNDATSCYYPLGLDDQDWNSQSLGAPVQRASTGGVLGALTYSGWNEISLAPALLLRADIKDGTRLELRVAGYAINSASEVRPILLDDARMMVGGCQCA